MISIIIPIYNAGKTLKKTLDSIKRQSYQNIEVVLINDGSTDRTEEICKEYVEKDHRFKYYYQDNKGVSEARNNGMRKASGKFITFIDADDIVDKEYCEILRRYSGDVDIVVCDISIEQNGVELKRFTMPNVCIDTTEALNNLFIRKNINSGPSGKLIKKELLKNIIFPDLTTYEDIIFNMKLFEEAKNVFVTNQTQYHYVQNNEGAMSKMLKCPSIDIIKATDIMMEYISNHDELDDECAYVTLSHLLQYVYIVKDNKSYGSDTFLKGAKEVFSKYRKQILQCRAFPWKEKILFGLYSFGIGF